MGEAPPAGAAAEWRRYWPLPIVAALGMASSGLTTHAIGPLMVPLAEEFGWTRTEISSGLTVCSLGSVLLYVWVNPLTMWLTFATFVGYAVIYTVILKPLTPQNIVIGGASGAMPPVLGWAAMTGAVGPESLILCLIIFLWTPPHFWALALYRVEDYRKSGLPMLPVTHGNEFTRLQILLYTLVLFAACLLPYVYGMSSWLYLLVAVGLSLGFCWHGFRLWREYSDALARQTFRFSLIHLSALFVALLVDHYLI